MRNAAILTLSIIAFLSLAIFGGRFQGARNFAPPLLSGGQALLSGGQAQLASPYVSGLHATTRTQDNTIQLSGDYLWRFVYAWDGTRWEQRDLGQLLNLTRNNVAGSLSQTDNRFIIAGAQSPVSIALSQLGATPPQYLAFWSANFQNNNWCGGCDEQGNQGEWQVINVAHTAIAAPSFAQSAALLPFGGVLSTRYFCQETPFRMQPPVLYPRIILVQNNIIPRWVVLNFYAQH